jgi:hypothetical protein
LAKRLFNGLMSILFVCASLFFVYIDFFLVASEVLPAVEQGSLNVETNSRILNHLWEGNEIYIVIGAYFLLACAFGYGAVRFGKRAFGR